MVEVTKLYRTRFSQQDIVLKNRIWKVLCDCFFSKHVLPKDTVVDIGAGYCEFINNINCGSKIAIDTNEDIKCFAAPEVKIIHDSCTAVESLRDDSVDVVFMSNFLEHLSSKQEVVETLRECRRILKAKGRIIILQPNIRFLADVYWDFFDHHIPLSDRSLAELLQSLSFVIVTVYPRFLPYTTKSRFPKGDLFVKLYLKCPWIWPLLGKQALLIAEK